MCAWYIHYILCLWIITVSLWELPVCFRLLWTVSGVLFVRKRQFLKWMFSRKCWCCHCASSIWLASMLSSSWGDLDKRPAINSSALQLLNLAVVSCVFETLRERQLAFVHGFWQFFLRSLTLLWGVSLLIMGISNWQYGSFKQIVHGANTLHLQAMSCMRS